MSMEIQEVSIAAIKPYAKNAKKHPQEQVDQIAASLRLFGFKQPLVVDRDGVLVIGHGRLLAAKQLGYKTVPVLYADDLTDVQIKALRLADNKVAESEWDDAFLHDDLSDLAGIGDIDMSDFGFDIDFDDDDSEDEDEDVDFDFRAPAVRHNVFENQERMQFVNSNYYGIPEMAPCNVVGDKMLRFCDFAQVEDPENYICHFFYDDFKFISMWREPDKHIERLKRFKAVVSPDFSVYTDFPRALQILACYRRQWVGAYWQIQGLKVIPDVRWGDRESYAYCFEGIPKGGTVAVSTVGVRTDNDWNGVDDNLWKSGYDEMMNRLEPSTIIFYGDIIEGCEGNIIHVPSFYAERRDMLNKKKEGNRNDRI